MLDYPDLKLGRHKLSSLFWPRSVDDEGKKVFMSLAPGYGGAATEQLAQGVGGQTGASQVLHSQAKKCKVRLREGES